MQELRQSTSITEPFGPFLDEDDGKTAEILLTIAQADIRLSKNGAVYAQSNDSGGATHDENGWYRLTLDATDTATLGRLLVSIHESGALPVWREYMVVTQNYWDSKYSTDKLQVHADEITNDLITSAAIAASGANKVADHTIRRTFQNACDSSDGDAKNFRSLLGAIGKLVNKIAPSGANLEIFEDDDITVLGTQAMTTDSGADPITALDTT